MADLHPGLRSRRSPAALANQGSAQPIAFEEGSAWATFLPGITGKTDLTFHPARLFQGFVCPRARNFPGRQAIATPLACGIDFFYDEERRVMGVLRTVALLAATGCVWLVLPTEASVSKPSVLFASERFCLAEAIYFEVFHLGRTTGETIAYAL